LSKYLESAIEKAIGLAMEDVPAFRMHRKLETDIIFAELIGERQHAARRMYTRTLSKAVPMPNPDIVVPNIEVIYGSKAYLSLL
jgi:hypothetical protein